MNILEKYNQLPKAVKVIPYVVLAGGLSALIKYLTDIEVEDVVLMGFVNVAIVALKPLLSLIVGKMK